jgi:hypothetical protein
MASRRQIRTLEAAVDGKQCDSFSKEAMVNVVGKGCDEIRAGRSCFTES